jgi:hypothetical protein
MKRNLNSIVMIMALVPMFLTSCKEEEIQMQVALSGEWSISSKCTGEVDRNTSTIEIFPGSGSSEILITNIVGQMVVFYQQVGEIPPQEYSTSPTSVTLPATADGESVSVNFTWEDPNYDPTVDEPEFDRSFTVTGSGSITDDEERMTLTLTVTFPNYDPFAGINEVATPKPLTNTCEYTLVQTKHYH